MIWLRLVHLRSLCSERRPETRSLRVPITATQTTTTRQSSQTGSLRTKPATSAQTLTISLPRMLWLLRNRPSRRTMRDLRRRSLRPRQGRRRGSPRPWTRSRTRLVSSLSSRRSVRGPRCDRSKRCTKRRSQSMKSRKIMWSVVTSATWAARRLVVVSRPSTEE